jgi:hypothetical protein
VAAGVPAMFCNFYLVKNHKIAKNSITTKARKKFQLVFNPWNFRNFWIQIS